MLTLTENAKTAVQTLTTQAGLPDEGGLRIAESVTEAGGFDLTLVSGPQQGDHVIDEDGARVFLEALTSDALSDQRLDAPPSTSGTGFRLAPQEEHARS